MLKIGIIGSGFGLYGLLPAFNYLKNCQMVSICGKRTPRLLTYCRKIGLKKIYTNWKLMLENEQLDVLALAVTPDAQYRIARFAISKDINIFAEKPLAANLQQARELLALAQKKKIKHTIDFLYPEIEAWKKVKQLINKKVLGELKQLNVNWDFPTPGIKSKRPAWKSDIKMGGGALSYYFSHSLYYLKYFAGEIVDLKSLLIYSKDAGSIEVGVDLELKFKNGVNGQAHLNSEGVGLNVHQIKFICETGEIVLENVNNSVTDFIIKIHRGAKVEQISLPEDKTKEGEDERARIVRKLAERFIKSCVQKKPIIPSFKEGARVQELIAKIRSQKVS